MTGSEPQSNLLIGADMKTHTSLLVAGIVMLMNSQNYQAAISDCPIHEVEVMNNRTRFKHPIHELKIKL